MSSLLETIQQNIDVIMIEGKKVGKRKLDPKAKVRNKSEPVFPAGSKDVTDSKDHFPLGNKAQAKSALSRVSAEDAGKEWFKGSHSELEKKVRSAVHRKYPGIEMDKAK